MNRYTQFLSKIELGTCVYTAFFLLSLNVYSQSIGINIANPDASAALEVYSKTAGVLIPRMTSAEISDITNPADGLIIYNSDTKNIVMLVAGVSYDLYNPNLGGGPNYSVTMLATGSTTSWLGIGTNTPEEFFGNSSNRIKMDLTNANEVRIMTNLSSFAVSIFGRDLTLALQYSTDDGANWNYLNTLNSGPKMVITSTGLQVSSWTSIDPAAKADVTLRLVGNSPGFIPLGASFGLTTIEAR